ncbi:DUF5010 domain-containing protein [Viscerimonas tarda]
MKTMIHKITTLAAVILFCCSSLLAQTEPYSNNWYVGNTKSGEWIKFKKVWLSAGHYRFTTRAVAGNPGATVHLEVNDESLKSNVAVPANSARSFESVHLGHKQLAEGYYDIKLVFETGDVNCDMIFIRKDESAADNFLPDDTKYELNFSQKMHTLAIGGVATATKDLLKGNEHGDDVTWKSTIDNEIFTRKQVNSYAKASMYSFDVAYSRNAADNYIQEMTEAKVQVIFAHGRGEPVENTKQIEDREFKTGPGGLPPAGLKYMVEAIQRNPYARNQMKVAYFVDNAPLTLATQAKFNGDYEWGNPAHQQFIWDYAIKKWYQTIPREMLYFTPDGKVPMQWWTANSHLDYGSSAHPPGTKILEFFKFIEQKMKEEFNLDVAFVLADNFFSRDSRAELKTLAWGVQGWFTWAKLPIEIVQHPTNGRRFAFALNGGRLPMREQVTSTWDPETNLPTPAREAAHFSSLSSDGTDAMIRPVLKQGHQYNCEWVVLEAWSDWREGSTWHRSGHKEYLYPNQYISLIREYADRNSGSILLEAEGCDEYNNTTPGNLGGAYRLDLYKASEIDKEYIDANLEVDLDIFRPLHSLSAIAGPIYNTTLDRPAMKIAAGWKDVWVIRESDKSVWCHEIDGYPVVAWRRATNSQALKDLTFSTDMVWAINNAGSVLSANLNGQQATNTASSWTNRNEAGITIVDVDASLSTVWGVSSANEVYYRNLSGTRPWTKVSGELVSIAADESYVWGFAPNGDLMCMPARSKSGWRKVENPYNVVRIDAGSDEVWGITADNKVYRISSSGLGRWQYVNEGFKEVSIGIDYVWLLDKDGKPWKYAIYGFEAASAFLETGISANVQLSDISVVARPNPFINQLTVEVSSYVAEDAALTVHDLNGKLLVSQSFQLYQGTNAIEVEGIEKLTSGVYVLSVNAKSQTIRTKVVKR